MHPRTTLFFCSSAAIKDSTSMLHWSAFSQKSVPHFTSELHTSCRLIREVQHIPCQEHNLVMMNQYPRRRGREEMIPSIRPMVSQDSRLHYPKTSNSGHTAKNDDRRFCFIYVQQRKPSIFSESRHSDFGFTLPRARDWSLSAHERIRGVISIQQL